MKSTTHYRVKRGQVFEAKPQENGEPEQRFLLAGVPFFLLNSVSPLF